MEKSVKKANIYSALSKFQGLVPIIFKDTEAYGYKYADLPAIIPVITPIMQECGLGYFQSMEYNETHDCNLIKTVVFHIESGEEISSTMRIKEDVSLAKMNDYQVLGSAITYYRRYQLSALLGLVTDKDTGAGGEQKPKAILPSTPVHAKTLQEAKTALSKVNSRITFEKVMAEFREFLQNAEIITICKDLSTKYPKA